MTQRIDAVEHRTVSIYDLVPHERNYNKHPQEQIERVKASLRRFSQIDDAIVKALPDGKYKIVAHECVTAAALQLLEAGECPHLAQWGITIVPQNWTDADVLGYMAASNETARLSNPDQEELVALLQEQQDAGFLLESMGSSEQDLQQMLEALGDAYVGESERDEAEDELPEQVETRAKVGDVWQLGRHRLYVGDCTNSPDLQRLLDIPIEAIVTDPPYAFGLASTSAMATKSGGWHDMMNNASWFMDRYNQWKQILYNGPIWVFCNWRTLPILMRAAFDSGVGIDSVMVWYKDWIGPGGLKGLRPTYELIGFTALGNYAIPDRGIEDFVNVGWSSHKPSGHKAEKPVDLLVHLLDISKCASIFDPFGGSGTTLIACEKTRRIARICEIEPKYADIILARFEQHTEQSAQLLERIEEGTHV